MKKRGYFAFFTTIVVIMLVAACSHRQNEQDYSPEVSTVDTIVTIIIDTTITIESEDEPEPYMAKIYKLVMKAPGESLIDSSDNQIVFNLNGYHYTLWASINFNGHKFNGYNVSVWRRPIGINSLDVLDSWSFKNDTLDFWTAKLPSTEKRVFYMNASTYSNRGPEYFYHDENENSVSLDSTQIEEAKSVEKKILENQEELNAYLRKNFGS